MSNNPGLIPNPISVTYSSPNTTGSLSYTPNPGVTGTAQITVTVMDDGGLANNGSNTFSQTFTVTVNAINQAPTLNPIDNPPAVLENSTTPQVVQLSASPPAAPIRSS